MTIRDVLEYVDEIHDNTFSDDLKCRWVAECEARVWTGVMLRDPLDLEGYRWEYDADRELLLPAPYDEIYAAYLHAKIYLAYHEAQQYQNAMAAYNRLFDQVSIWYAKTYDPVHGGGMEIPAVPTIVQGETAAVAFTLPYAATALSALRAVISRSGAAVYTFEMGDMELSGTEAVLTLTQEQSLQLPPGIISIAIGGADTEGNRFEAWPPLAIRVVETGIGGAL